MASHYDHITEDQRAFIARQHMFCVATGTREGRINLSPKGMDTFRVLDEHTVMYVDYTGSGNETAAHLHHDGRVTFMFCGFEQKPNILRLYGRGKAIQPGDPEWDTLFVGFQPEIGQRQIIKARIDATQDSCGFAVPRYAYEGERDTLREFARSKGEEALARYRATKNRVSIDGLVIP